MITQRKRFFLLTMLAMALYLPSAWAQDGTMGDYFGGITSKLGRGLVNVLSSPFEIPCTISEEIYLNKSTGFFTGLGKGIVFMLRRMLVGVTEMGTFIIPMEPTLPVVCQSR